MVLASTRGLGESQANESCRERNARDIKSTWLKVLLSYIRQVQTKLGIK